MPSLDTFWSIPPIQDAIACHLDFTDYYSCIHVSHAFHAAFIPFLWETIEHRHHGSLPHFFTSPAQAHTRHLVKTLHVDDSNAKEWIDHHNLLGPFPALTSLCIQHHYWKTEDTPSDLVDIAGMHSTLTSLDIRNQKGSTSFLDGMVKALQALTHLSHLHLEPRRAMAGRELACLLVECGRVEKLEIIQESAFSSSSSSLSSSPLDAYDSTQLKFPETRIQCLFIRVPGANIDPIILSFLKSCPHLEKLQWVTNLLEDQHAQEFTRVLSNHCPLLKDLSMGTSPEVTPWMGQALWSSPFLTHLRLWIPKDHLAVLRAIVDRHGPTLEMMDIYRGHPFGLEDLFQVASSCPGLKSLRIKIRLEDWSEETLDTVRAVRWNVGRLKMLGIYLHECLWTYDERVFMEGMEMIYREVGQLRMLEEWVLCLHNGNALLTKSFERGLQHLGRLKRLNHFYFSDCLTYPMKEEVLKKIVDVWVGLDYITGLSRLRSGTNGQDLVNDLRSGRGSGRDT